MTAPSDNAPPTPTPRRARKRSKAWIYYTVITLLLLAATVAHPSLAAVGATTLVGLYARYLYRGGRIVIWIW
jgi:hypothetical protein